MSDENDIIICRCEDITLRDIKEAISKGAKDINSIKKLTRAGMGPCQGLICRNLIQNIFIKELKIIPDNKLLFNVRPPIFPIKIKGFANINENE